MHPRRRDRLGAFALAAIVAACAPIPSLTFVTDGDASTPMFDATIPGNDAGASTDAGADDAAMDLYSLEAGSSDAAIKCGSSLVTDCSSCAGAPLRCKRGARDECVADCVSCAANLFPCLHCPSATAAPRGSCVGVGATGQIACATTNLCPCTVDTDCLPITGAAQVCEVVSGRPRCLTCGAPTTAGLACVLATGDAGVCHVDSGAAPTCK